MKGLIIEKSVSKTMDAIRNINDGLNNKKKQFIIAKYIDRKVVIGFFILTIIITSLILVYLNWPILQTISKNIKNTNQTYNSKEITDKNLEQKEIAIEKSGISTEDYNNLKKELDNTKAELDNYKKKNDIQLMLRNIENFIDNKNYEKAVTSLLTMKNLNLDDEAKNRFDKLWSELKANYIWTIYNDGDKLYKQGKYQEALPKLIIASEVEPSVDIMPWILYQIGECYKETNDKPNALVFFQEVKKSYPKSQYASYSERVLVRQKIKLISKLEEGKNLKNESATKNINFLIEDPYDFPVEIIKKSEGL